MAFLRYSCRVKVLLIDNYDSFTYNLYQLIASLGVTVDVVKNDEISADDAFKKNPTHIVISPGPGNPSNAGVSNDIVRRYRSSQCIDDKREGNELPLRIPLLGVCLGHQCIASVFTPDRNPVHRASKPRHGKTSPIFHEKNGIMRGIPSPFNAARYHSLIVDRLPRNFELMCWTMEGKKKVNMGMRHVDLPMFGVQFHPESFLTEYGTRIIKNFLAC